MRFTWKHRAIISVAIAVPFALWWPWDFWSLMVAFVVVGILLTLIENKLSNDAAPFDQ
jgi:hypothetical protein